MRLLPASSLQQQHPHQKGHFKDHQHLHASFPTAITSSLSSSSPKANTCLSSIVSFSTAYSTPLQQQHPGDGHFFFLPNISKMFLSCFPSFCRFVVCLLFGSAAVGKSYIWSPCTLVSGDDFHLQVTSASGTRVSPGVSHLWILVVSRYFCL